VSYTVHDPQLFYDDLVIRLALQTGATIGRGEAPSDKTLPYAVVYPLGEPGDLDVNGVLGDPHVTTVFEWQVTSVGGTAKQAEWMQTQVRSALLGWSPTGDYGRIAKSGGQGTRRDDGVQPAQFFAVDTFTVFAS
jgi:hypothetical protein